jgi:rubrerythrin
MPTKKFQRNQEDFVCENCGTKVRGTGYTNHCPNCLWSKHVDINPGDREAECNGLMKPIDVEVKNGEYILVHVCQICGLKKKNKMAKNDNLESMFKINIDKFKNL